MQDLRKPSERFSGSVKHGAGKRMIEIKKLSKIPTLISFFQDWYISYKIYIFLRSLIALD